MAVALLLLTSCANAANLLLGRAASRQKEVALRVSLGAARWRVVRQFLTESLSFAVAGGAAGVALAGLATAWCSAKLAPVLLADGIEGFAIDGRVLVFALLVSLATAVVFGILPALRGTGVKLCDALKESGPGHSGGASRQRLAGLLVMLEVTLSVVLVTTAGLLISSIAQYWRIDWGFPMEHRLLAAVTPSEGTHGAPAVRLRFYTELLARARQLPGVESAALAGTVPLDLGVPFLRVAAERSGRVQAAYRAVSPAYHETLGMALRRGRLFNDADRQDTAPVAIVSESLAKKLWPEQEAVGARIQVNGTWRQVVGVTANVNQSMARMPRHEVAVPVTQAPPASIRLVLRTQGDPSTTAPAVRRMIAALDPDLPISDLRTFRAAGAMLRAPYEFILALLGAFAVCAVLLSGAGIYGVTSRGVAIRTREIGIRVALGAEPRQVLRGVLRTGLKLALAGTLLGSLGALFAIKALLTQIWWATPVPVFVWIVPVAAFTAALALVASFVPARRATNIAPAAALRAE
jgi:putative ABC transport system permease protein